MASRPRVGALKTHHALYDFAKDDMLAIQPGCLDCRDKELGAVGVFASISHAHPAGPIVFQLEVLIGKALTVDALTWEERQSGSGELSWHKPSTSLR